MGIPIQCYFFRCQCLCVLLIYITCRIFCANGITLSQIFCELLHFEMLVLENLPGFPIDGHICVIGHLPIGRLSLYQIERNSSGSGFCTVTEGASVTKP
jgi:hypothetical protein